MRNLLPAHLIILPIRGPSELTSSPCISSAAATARILVRKILFNSFKLHSFTRNCKFYFYFSFRTGFLCVLSSRMYLLYNIVEAIVWFLIRVLTERSDGPRLPRFGGEKRMKLSNEELRLEGRRLNIKYQLLLTWHKCLKTRGHTKSQLINERWLVLAVDLNFDACFVGGLICGYSTPENVTLKHGFPWKPEFWLWNWYQHAPKLE